MGNALLQALAEGWRSRGGAGLPAWFRERQRRALDAASAAPWPARGAEAWKYTSLHALAQRQPQLVPGAAVADDVVGADLVFSDGVALVANGDRAAPRPGIGIESLASALARDDERLRFVLSRESEDGDVFDYVNAAFATDGALLRADAGAAVEAPVVVRIGGGEHEADVAWHLLHRIEFGEGSRVRAVFDIAGASTPAFATQSLRIRLQRDAQLELDWLQAPSEALSLIARSRIELEAGARLVLRIADGGAAPSRHDLRVELRGEGASAELGGVFLLGGRRHADTQLDLRHESAGARSRTVWRAVAGDRGRAVFDGHITVQPGADGTDAQLACKSLLLSAQAEVDVKPVLEIYADDVKCAHGATVGQLDAQALFYLRSRGFSEAEARSLLLRAFCAEAFGAEAGSPAQQRLSVWLDEAQG